MKYLETINKNIIKCLKNEKKIFVFGQNINSGSYIGGLSKNIDKIKNIKLYNTPNCEYSIIGSGFGFIISGGAAIFFAKQLDFMLLGCDHFVNTLNSIKNNNQLHGKFKIILFVCDQGYQGSQSSFNNIDDLSSLAQFDSYQINTRFESEQVTNFFFNKKGFDIYSVSQRLSKEEIFSENPKSYAKNFSFIEYFQGNEKTIISSNFAFNYALNIKKKIEKKSGKKVGLINSNFVISPDIKYLISKIKKQKEIIFISDSKSINHRFFRIINELNIKAKVKCIYRKSFSWNSQIDNMSNNLLNSTR
jgi:pyruvate/2-oxoglutarate/acetoin dehydrogenase E1 component